VKATRSGRRGVALMLATARILIIFYCSVGLRPSSGLRPSCADCPDEALVAFPFAVVGLLNSSTTSQTVIGPKSVGKNAD
jgi:hypothetical protein